MKRLTLPNTVCLKSKNNCVKPAAIRRQAPLVNPHFVFNALNTLDELIAVAPEQASSYLQHFASLYRMSLRYAEQQLVPLSDELNFARHYFQLMQLRLASGLGSAVC